MDIALHELPLAFFTTLAPIGAGAFVTLAVVFFTKTFSGEEYKAIDKLMVIPLLFCLVGLIASFMHLANPLHSLAVASTLGTTPLANEILVFGIFCIVAVVYWIVAMAGKLTAGARKGLIAASAVLAVLFAIFVGLAYTLPTIPTWNTPLSPLMILGFLIFGGALLGMLVLALATKGNLKLEGTTQKSVLGVLTVGAAVTLISVIAFYVSASGTQSTFLDVAALSGSLLPCFIVFIVCSAAAWFVGFKALQAELSLTMVGAGVVLVIVAVFLARLCFYGLQIGVAL